MSDHEPTVGKTAWLTQYIETTRSRYQHAAVEHQRNALRLEGAAMARPVITTDGPGCRAVVDHGVTGFHCEPRCSTSLVEAIEQFNENDVMLEGTELDEDD